MKTFLERAGVGLLTLFFLTLAVSTTHLPFAFAAPTADAVVGNGTPASCTEANFNTALNTVQGSGSGTITFNCGGPATITFTAEKSITADVTINGGGIINLSGGNTNRLFNIANNATLTLKDITLQNGYDGTFGGGAIISYGDLEMDGATIRDSNVYSGYSGGAVLSYGPVSMVDSLIENNTGGSAGGLFMLGLTAVADITTSTFRNNRTTNNAYGLGGAITVWDDAPLFIYDSILEQNQANVGGAIFTYNSSSSTVVSGSTLRLNTAKYTGGAIHSEYSAPVNNSSFPLMSIMSSLITDNSATEGAGGGIFNIGSTMFIDDSTIRNNTAPSGGGIFNENRVVYIATSTIVSNVSQLFGGGFYSRAGSNIDIKNSTFSANDSYYGGGFFTEGDTQVKITFVTFNDNISNEFGSGSNLYNKLSSVIVQNVIFQDDLDSNCSGNPITSLGFNLASDASCTLNGAGDVLNTDAQLGPLQNNGGPTLTHMPQLGSPAIDNGQCVANIDFDQRGYARPQSGICDKGAVERRPNDVDGFFVFLPAVIR